MPKRLSQFIRILLVSSLAATTCPAAPPVDPSKTFAASPANTPLFTAQALTPAVAWWSNSRLSSAFTWRRAAGLMVLAAAAYHGDHSQSASAFLIGIPLFPRYWNSKFLSNVIQHRRMTAQRMDVSVFSLRRILKPRQLIRTRFQFRLDSGELSAPIPSWRIVEREIGKGGIRATSSVQEADVYALELDMGAKLSRHILLEEKQLHGGKGGSMIDLGKLSRAEKARWMRGYVQAIMNAVWEKDQRVAFGPIFDVPAPDVGTSPNDIALMDYFADEYNRWLVKNATYVLPVLDRADPVLANDLRVLQSSVARYPVNFDESGEQLDLPYVKRILSLRELEELRSLRLLACVTGKTAPKENGPFYGAGGIRGRGEATGQGLAFATLEWLKLRGVLPQEAMQFTGQSVAIDGFGNVGSGAVAAYLRTGAKVLAIAEIDMPTRQEFAFFKPDGFTAAMSTRMLAYKANHGNSLLGFENTEEARANGIIKIEKSAFWKLPVDILVPAAVENSITPAVAETIQAQYVAEGANGPTTVEADEILHRKHIDVIPDIVANSGGVIVSWMEMRQNVQIDGTPLRQAEVYEQLHRLMAMRLRELFDYMQTRPALTLRDAAHDAWLQTRLDARKGPPGARLNVFQKVFALFGRFNSYGLTETDTQTKMRMRVFLSA